MWARLSGGDGGVVHALGPSQAMPPEPAKYRPRIRPYSMAVAPCVDPGGDIARTDMFARIGVMQALNRSHVREFNPKQEGAALGPTQASEGPMTVFIYVNTAKQVGDSDQCEGVCKCRRCRKVVRGK